MDDTRHRNREWALPTNQTGAPETWQAVEIAVLMDVREELQNLNRLLRCPNFLEIPDTLRGIRRNTAKKSKSKKR